MDNQWDQQDQHDRQDQRDQRIGILTSLAAFTWWGLTPIYFKTLVVVAPLEMVAHRILWAIPLLAGFLFLRDGAGFWKRLVVPMRTLLILAVTGSLMTGGWLLFIWAVSKDQILETSFGYFINPLVSVLLGYVFLKERLTRIQLVAVLVVTAGMVYFGWFLARPPWISLSLSFLFGFYGLFRKQLKVGPMVGLFWEAALFAPLALIVIGWMNVSGLLAFGQLSTVNNLLLAGAGLITIMPLIWFNVSAQKLPLKTISFFQYIAPTLSLLVAVILYDEPFTRGHAVGLAAISIALVLISSESIIRSRRDRSL